ncbi:DMT family transporter [Marimonas sp. MJW-29]|uniref:DMT family transporter n=1 Tax=Sulfitobacter sediminis TaxID=3234186 RepID=A0ABV3RJU7_9RHOB
MTPTSPSLFTGYAAAWIIVFVWSGWLIVSRVAENSGLTIYDLAALRYGLAALVGVPLCYFYRDWQKLSLKQIAGLSFILGPIYILCVFAGFLFAPAAHGGIFMNGVLPLVGIVIGFALFGNRPSQRQTWGGVLIFVSALALGLDRSGAGTENAWVGDLLFMVGAVFFSFYVVLSERWQINAIQIIFCGTVVNAVIYLPIWALFLPSGLAEAPAGPLLLQAIYQGFVPNLMGLLFIAHASRRIGTVSTSSILAAVPGMGGLLGWMILGEALSGVSLVALGMLTVGLLIAVRSRRPKPWV